MPSSEQIVAEARRWRDTPFRHQGRVHGVGVDCAGLIVGVARALGVEVADRTDYARTPHADMLRQVVEVNCGAPVAGPRPTDDQLRPGDVLLMRFEAEPQHLALYCGQTIIHAYQRVGRVVEHRFAAVWRACVVAAYRFPGVSDER